ncbi:MAG: hypothetical protein V4643_08345 [Bacteroidota bacterium]
MRNNIIIAAISITLLLILNSCARVRTFSTGLPNEAYLEFVGNPKDFKGGVEVKVDDNTEFNALVKKDYAEKPTGYIYSISKGTHTLTISYHGKVIYNNKIFVSPQETKKIVL